MAPSTALVRLYLGSGYTQNSAKKAGTSLGQIGLAGANVRRQKLLRDALAAGKIKKEDLGPQDRLTAGLDPSAESPNLANKVVGNPFKSAIGLLGNFGSDIGQAGKYFFPGLYESAKAGVSDIFSL